MQGGIGGKGTGGTVQYDWLIVTNHGLVGLMCKESDANRSPHNVHVAVDSLPKTRLPKTTPFITMSMKEMNTEMTDEELR